MSIGRIYHDRSPPGRYDPRTAIPPEVVIADGKVGLRIVVPAIPVGTLPRLPFIFGRFLRCEELFVSQLQRTFERCECGVRPYALKVRLTISSAGSLASAQYGREQHAHYQN